MLLFGPISSRFDILTFGLMWWVLGANSVAQLTLFQSGWLVVGLWLPWGPLASYSSLQALPAAYCGWLLDILLGYSTLPASGATWSASWSK